LHRVILKLQRDEMPRHQFTSFVEDAQEYAAAFTSFCTQICKQKKGTAVLTTAFLEVAANPARQVFHTRPALQFRRLHRLWRLHLAIRFCSWERPSAGPPNEGFEVQSSGVSMLVTGRSRFRDHPRRLLYDNVRAQTSCCCAHPMRSRSAARRGRRLAQEREGAYPARGMAVGCRPHPSLN
jgi:hypothetical protein